VKIALLDYKNCSLIPIYYSIKAHNVSVEIIQDLDKIEKFDKLVMPGVGATNQIMKYLNENNLTEKIKLFAKEKKILGICAGMQIMAKKLYENNVCEGLGFFDADVISINDQVHNQNMNIGWSNISINNSSYYFCHSHYLNFYDQNDNEILASIDLKKKIPAIIQKNNIIGVQFHPEKSQRNGRNFLSDFLYDKL
jgi:imidazole glycerol-phosphate synthase subunit HisH